MKAIHYIYTLLAAAMLLASCTNDDTDFGQLVPDRDFESLGVELDYSALTEPQETVPADDNDYMENNTFDAVVSISFSGSTAVVSGAGTGVSVQTDGAHVTVSSSTRSVEYVLSGASSDGSFKIYSRNKFKVVMNGVQLHNPHGAAVNSQCGKSMYVVLADGTANKLSCGSDFVFAGSEKQKGAMFSEGQILFSGTGSLQVESAYKSGIASDDYLLFRPGVHIDVSSTAGNGLKANDGIYIRGGVLNIQTSADGGKAINCEDSIKVSGGRTTAIATGTYLVEGTDTTNVAALKCDSSLIVSGGAFYLKSSGRGAKGIKANGDVLVSGGDVRVLALGASSESSPKAVKCDGKATVSGGSFYAYSKHSSAITADKGFSHADGSKSSDIRGKWLYYVSY